MTDLNEAALKAEIERLRGEVEKWVFYAKQTMLMYKDIQLEERAKIVAWLRDNAMGERWDALAQAIEAGEHLK